ncbi:rod outer segment membrane protein 1 [Orussus abietinus]|uniref:rod outer segment membrane protein 1 n=1 Tax=Orussus abietinus TaxID=222816 RepID=UPI000C715AE0|nr:rod outer segment membrane protein 1 [Orussus abietinus]
MRGSWETRSGRGVAIGLAAFETKRLILLAFEVLVEGRMIRFAGGLRPVALSVAASFVGLPCALIAAWSIGDDSICGSRGRRRRQRLLQGTAASALVCAALNSATLSCIGYAQANARPRALAEAFDASMRLYLVEASRKRFVDELQLSLQCCGCYSYVEWFLFDWQRADYGPREEISPQRRISDESARPRGVPFSCCSLASTRPCAPWAMSRADLGTISRDGCVSPLGRALRRRLAVAYVVTAVALLAHLQLAFLAARMASGTRRGRRCGRLEVEQQGPSTGGGAARIEPSAHSEHRLPNRRARAEAGP